MLRSELQPSTRQETGWVLPLWVPLALFDDPEVDDAIFLKLFYKEKKKKKTQITFPWSYKIHTPTPFTQSFKPTQKNAYFERGWMLAFQEDWNLEVPKERERGREGEEN